MRVVNTVELKNRTNELLRDVVAGEPVIVTLHGKPAAAITRLTEGELAEFILKHAGRGGETGGARGPWRFTSLSTSFGEVYVAYSARGVSCVDLAPGDEAFRRTFRRRFGAEVTRDPHPPRKLVTLLREFFTDFKPFRGPVDLSLVGPFQRRVLEQLRRIPRGQIRTYRDIARAIGQPGATRAVGTACARNPVPLIIPCHRVVRSDGGLGGYSLRGGPAFKQQLLAREGVDVNHLRIA
ncbi:MAG: type II toxin-antitoxin system prevent-host-death family antitoxin [Armatimonadota bacterium]|nr:type II toxin-antitoxin system prevent-host-death family antitoxin [Armatimonadota bacterium]MDR7452090.1 type II toxin-antitoxin system prevent-host-death family antitoxin [Armatimonadota bacterium]MDR7466552.1 type II toxin-antitoxin system prevent-host-death family antitoxin [Armatimonadota bacterium]MDR7493274.1 type II toxin-antitoxin system prevent-host-death family antitoxin [Armatimonadota bacterium]MDR7499833.1 type II toxin-antitoxin system prevent-host-death family antitoxin [Arma